VYEHSRWIAEEAYASGLGPEADSADGLAKIMAETAAKGTDAQKLALISAHPDLAGRLARARRLTAESTTEQASAGLDHLTSEEYERFGTLNASYREKFGIPFVMAVKGRSKQEILAAFETRLSNNIENEISAALREIDQIAALRLKDILP
jgi:urate oxidase